jgi:hypothetical protein
LMQGQEQLHQHRTVPPPPAALHHRTDTGSGSPTLSNPLAYSHPPVPVPAPALARTLPAAVMRWGAAQPVPFLAVPPWATPARGGPLKPRLGHLFTS